MTWERAKDATQNGRETLSSGVVSLIGKVEEATGLKLRETLGFRDHAAAAVKAKTVEVSQKAEESFDAAKAVVEEKAQEVKEAAEQKVEQAKRLV